MKKPSFPNAMVLLVSFIVFAGFLSYVVPAGQYERVYDQEIEREVVIPGSYQVVQQQPVSIGRIFMAVPEGMVDAAEIMVIILLSGAGFYVIDKTGALKEGIATLAHHIDGKEEIGLILIGLVFCTLGALNGFQEEIIALTPMLLIFTRKVGYGPLLTVAVSLGAAIIGSTFSPINPFGVGIAQKMAEISLVSGAMFRVFFLVLAFILWMTMIILYGRKNRSLRRKLKKN
ncbi:MAG: hypothetical protein O2887_13960 [Bacteroidetes bacterium]|nr:hypothetical protein [Bacteroidota bacterium]MDA1121574.1 hypothetical protein [Bacteroidota bacterium]